MFFTLPGFEQDHVEVQRMGSDVLAITGQRPVDDGHKCIRFEKLIRFRAICNLGEYRDGFGKRDFIITIPKIIDPLVHNNDKEVIAKQLPTGDATTTAEQQRKAQVDSGERSVPAEMETRGERSAKATVEEVAAGGDRATTPSLTPMLPEETTDEGAPAAEGAGVDDTSVPLQPPERVENGWQEEQRRTEEPEFAGNTATASAIMSLEETQPLLPIQLSRLQ
ncbi:unnamed protein product [Linum trigynum]|uniref:SHSP domain-containing protein n=1 Tax=Linum trigynum TaxID=586398 RepID=A0AAV2CQW7_9ROSI